MLVTIIRNMTSRLIFRLPPKTRLYRRKKQSWLLICSGLIVIVSLGGFALLQHDRGQKPLSEVPEVFTGMATTRSGQSWVRYIGKTDHFSMEIPATWQRQIELGDDPEDLYQINFGNKLGVQSFQDPQSFSGNLTVSTTQEGHGTPGRLIEQRPATVGLAAGTRMVWESDILRLVQYRWTNHGKYYLLEILANKNALPIFATFDQLATTVSLD